MNHDNTSSSVYGFFIAAYRHACENVVIGLNHIVFFYFLILADAAKVVSRNL